MTAADHTRHTDGGLRSGDDATAVSPSVRRPAWGHWPGLLGLAVAVSQVVAGVDAEGTATTVAAAASCYLAAAALGRRWIAWVGILVVCAVVLGTELAGVPWWIGLAGYAVALVVVGLARPTAGRAVLDQGLAMLVFGGLAVVALFISPRWGLALAGLVLAGHAVWDYRHWRRNDVVPRSLAEACIMLDVPIGCAAMLVAVTG